MIEKLINRAKVKLKGKIILPITLLGLGSQLFAANLPKIEKGAKSQPSNQWIELRGCKLVEDKSNDGDSFKIAHNQKELVVRLYMVDCPETNYEFTERILKQMEYFQASPGQIMQLGEIAKSISKKFLTKPFTVYTKGENALGAGPEPRAYAIIVGANRQDLGTLLVETGLARNYGKPPAGYKSGNTMPKENAQSHPAENQPMPPTLKKMLENYKALELSARNKQLGIWGQLQQPRLGWNASKFITSNELKQSILKAKSMEERKGKDLQALLDTLKVRNNKRKNETNKYTNPHKNKSPKSQSRPKIEAQAQNSIFITKTPTTQTRPQFLNRKGGITKEELNLLLPKSKEIDSKNLKRPPNTKQ